MLSLLRWSLSALLAGSSICSTLVKPSVFSLLLVATICSVLLSITRVVAMSLVVAMILIFVRSLFVVNWLFGYMMPPFAEDVTRHDVPHPSRPVRLTSVAFPVVGDFSTFLCAAGVYFFVGNEEAGV